MNLTLNLHKFTDFIIINANYQNKLSHTQILIVTSYIIINEKKNLY